jgi:Holliday junction resolvase RusA-like endonuclease
MGICRSSSSYSTRSTGLMWSPPSAHPSNFTAAASEGHVAFFVPGRPVAKGVMVAYCPHAKRTKPAGHACRPIVTEDSRRRGAHSDALRDWLSRIAVTGRSRVSETLRGAVDVDIRICVARPKSNKDPYPTSRHVPDLDKICRGVIDAISAGAGYGGNVIADDSQVCALSASIRYPADATDIEGVLIGVYPLV